LLGRFIQADTLVPNPSVPQSLNRYAYVGNNPVRYVDPSGHRYIAPRPDPEETPNPGPEILLTGKQSPTGDPMQVYWSEIETWEPAKTSDVMMVLGSPLAAPAVGIGSEILLSEFVIPGAHALWGKLVSWAGLACADGDCGNEVSTVVEYAQSLQGYGKYPGVDEFAEITLKEGDIVVGGLPGQSAFYTTLDALNEAEYIAERLWEGLQVAPHVDKGYRMFVGVYRVVSSTPAATGRALANPQFGSGGFTQYVIQNFEEALELIKILQLH